MYTLLRRHRESYRATFLSLTCLPSCCPWGKRWEKITYNKKKKKNTKEYGDGEKGKIIDLPLARTVAANSQTRRLQGSTTRGLIVVVIFPLLLKSTFFFVSSKNTSFARLRSVRVAVPVPEHGRTVPACVVTFLVYLHLGPPIDKSQRWHESVFFFCPVTYVKRNVKGKRTKLTHCIR